MAGLNHWKDINAVAGLLRVYFRELEDPLFPSAHYQDFIKASREYKIMPYSFVTVIPATLMHLAVECLGGLLLKTRSFLSPRLGTGDRGFHGHFELDPRLVR